MTYKDQFVVEVKADGQILRVRDGAVYLPFGCEYSILLKNLNSRKASVKVSIDGEDVLDGNSLILDPLLTHELQGFLRGITAKNRFRFIQKTEEIQKHRGDKVDDGLVRVEFAFEKPRPEPIIKKIINEIHEHHHHHHTYWANPYTWYDGSGWKYMSNDNDTVKYGSSGNPVHTYNISSGGDIARGVMDSVGVQASFNANNTPAVDEGITVKGNEIYEQYMYGMIGELEESSVIVISLKGMQQGPGVVVQDPITVKTKLECPSCGLKSKSSFKFCPNCGTFLE
jgi:hypothetical protein